MIPIDWKLQIFPYTCLFIFLVIIVIFGERTSATLQILFSRVPYPLINKRFICQQASYLHMFAPLHSAIDRREHEKYLFLTFIWKYGETTRDSARP